LARVRILVVMAVACWTVAAFAVPAQASVPAASAFCKPITGISAKLQKASSDTASYDAKTFSKFAAALRSSAKHAPKAVKAAANKLATFYSALGDPVHNADAFSKGSKDLSKSISTYFTYVATHC
jgi:cytochrome c556